MACHYKPYFLHYATKNISYNNPLDKSALIIVDVQKAFLPGGSMAILSKENVSNSKKKSVMMINNINNLIESNKFDYHIYVQDSHPDNHVSFASTYKSAKPFQVIDLNINTNTNTQIVLYPDHCRIDGRDLAPRDLSENSPKDGSGIEFADELLLPKTFTDPDAEPDLLSEKSFVLNKGEDINSNPFSAFKNYLGQDTGLHNTLIKKGVKNIYVCGLARDFCVWWTAIDASSYFNVNIQRPVFNVTMIWDSSLPVYTILPVQGNTLLLPDYKPEEQSNSPHRLAIHNFLEKNKDRSIQDILKGYVSNDSRSNRWVQCFLTPYGVNAVNTSDLISAIVPKITGSFPGVIEKVKKTSKDLQEKIITDPTLLNFLKNIGTTDIGTTDIDIGTTSQETDIPKEILDIEPTQKDKTSLNFLEKILNQSETPDIGMTEQSQLS